MLKKILLTCMCISLMISSATFAQAEASLTDKCDDFSNLYEYSEYWSIQTNNKSKLGEDGGRFQRKSGAVSDDADDSQYITYYYPRPESAEVLFYYTSEEYISAVTISGSSDNVSFTELETTRTAYTGCDSTSSWSGAYIKATDIPDGVKYIKIEIDKSANVTTGCAIGQVTLVQGESSYVNTAIPEPGEYNITEDNCLSFDMLYDKSENWRVETSEDKWGDAGRIIKSTDTDTEYLVYKIPSVVKLDMAINYTGMTDPFEFVTVEASPDGENYTVAEIPDGAPAGLTGGNWSTYTASIALPKGTEYVKISVSQTDYTAPWWLNFVNFKFYSSSPYEIKDGEIDVTEGTAAADYTIKVNYKVYDNITMYLAAYDESGLLLDICAESATAEMGDVQLNASLDLPDETKYVRAFFLNGLQGMHRICETQEQ